MVFGATLFNEAEAYGQGIKGEMKVKMVLKESGIPLEEEKESANDVVMQIKQIGCGSKIVGDSDLFAFGQAIVTEPIKIMGEFNVIGEVVKRINCNGKELILEKGAMKAGIYFLQIVDKNKTIINKKIIIQ